VVGITIAGRETVDPRGWERTWGVAAGLAGPGDGVVGLDGEQPWTADFELIGPAGDAGRVAVLVDVENRGGRSTHGMIGPELVAGRLAYARVQWQGSCRCWVQIKPPGQIGTQSGLATVDFVTPAQ